MSDEQTLNTMREALEFVKQNRETFWHWIKRNERPSEQLARIDAALTALEQAAPLLTPERVEALRRAIVALEEEQSEYMTTQYPSARDLEIEGAVDVLEKLLKEAEGATDE